MGKLMLATNITTQQGWPDHRTIDYICDQFFDTVEPYLVHDDKLGVSRTAVYQEDIVFGREGKSAARAKVRGVLEWNLRHDRHPIFGVTPSAVNSFLAGKYGVKYPAPRGSGLSRAEKRTRIKELTQTIIYETQGYYTKDDNIADAYAIALFGVAHAVEKQNLSAVPMYKVL